MRRWRMGALAALAGLFLADPAAAYKESLESQGGRFDFLSELNYVGEDKPMLLRGCGNGGPTNIRFFKIRQYYDRKSDTHLWVITNDKRKDVLYYASGRQISCVIEQQ